MNEFASKMYYYDNYYNPGGYGSSWDTPHHHHHQQHWNWATNAAENPPSSSSTPSPGLNVSAGSAMSGSLAVEGSCPTAREHFDPSAAAAAGVFAGKNPYAQAWLQQNRPYNEVPRHNQGKTELQN